MSPGTIILIAVPVLIVLAGVLLFASARRRDTGSAQGVLSSETAAARPRPGRAVRGRPAGERPRGRAGRRGRPARVGRPREGRRAARRLGAARRGDPRRHPPPVLQPLDRRVVRARACPRFGAGMLAFLWPSGTGGFGSKITVGKLSDIFEAIDEGDGFAYYPEGRMWVTRVSRRGAGEGRGRVHAERARRHGGGRRRPLPEVPAPRLPGPAVPVVPVVRVRLPRLAVQPGRARRRAVPPRVAWTASP